MAHTLYSHEARILMCSNCGAPIDVSVGGGQTTCSYCGAVNTISQRDESADIKLAEQAPTMGESERLGYLRAQDAAPQPFPAGLEGYLFGSDLALEKANDALAFWQTCRRQVQVGGAFPDQDRLFYLTILLAPVVEQKTRRALVESTLELLPDQRHRHVLRCILAENAVVAGDLDAAQKWLRPCNPRATDLRMDTHYRVAAAALATAQGGLQQVLTLLGSRPGDIPLADELEAKADLLRANAVEKLMGVELAVGQLTLPLFQQPWLMDALQRGAQELAPLNLCPQTLQGVAASFWGTVDAKLRPATVTSMGCLVLGSLVPVAGVMIMVAAALGLFSPDPAAIINLIVHPLIWLVAVPTGILVAAFYGRQKALRLRDQGILTSARVVSSKRRVVSGKNSSTTYQDVSLYVLIDGAYMGTSKSLAQETPVHMGVYPCLVDPQNLKNVAIQLTPLR